MNTRRKQFLLIQVFISFIFFLSILKFSHHFNKADYSFSSEYQEITVSTVNTSNITTTPPESNIQQENRIIIEKIKTIIRNHNKNQIILNNDIFEPLTNDSIVIAVQVHNRLEYLRHLINSLSNAANISQVLLIFSHDLYDDDINTLVGSIKFCRVLQIFYPFSIQLHPYEFPGTDPNDCTRDMDKTAAIGKNCTNLNSADSFGHYREARFTQIKHHWWWKATRIFDQLSATKYHNGLVLFLEEDHFVAPDFLHILKLLKLKASEVCTSCNVLVLGKYKIDINNSTFAKSDFNTNLWRATRHNMGMAFHRNVWNEIKSCSSKFCTYDDYNWDWSLQDISRNCMRTTLTAICSDAPRVFHIGHCGTHAGHQNECDALEMISSLRNSFDFSEKFGLLYPKNLTTGEELLKHYVWKNNGGWGDKRDHELCLNITKNSD